jgi:uncharacterized membrane protein
MFQLWLLIFILIIILFIKHHSLKQDLSRRIEVLEILVKDLSKKLRASQAYEKKVEKEPLQARPEEIAKYVKPDVPPQLQPEVKQTPIREQGPPPFPKVETGPSHDFIYIKEDHEIKDQTTSEEETDRKNRWEQFKENVDWEQFTGAKLFAWIGGIALFIGAGFFVKYSIDRNLIPPTMRLIIGAITGLMLIIASGRFERVRYDIMRHTLGASGTGVLYSVIFSATLYYHYLPNLAGFGLLTVVSAAAFVLAVFHGGIAISVLGAIGAYATPILVDTGRGDLYMLLVYLAIVNIGLYQVMSRLKSSALLLVAVIGTIVSLTMGSFMTKPVPSVMSITLVWIINMVLFGVFLEFMKARCEKASSLLWAGITLFTSVLAIAGIIMLEHPGPWPMVLITAGMSGAMVLARNDDQWQSFVIPYSTLTFCAAMLWAFYRFEPQGISWSFILFLVYGVAGGVGPVLLIRKYGIKESFLSWLKSFPVAVAGLSLTTLFKDASVSFWFWPMTLGLQIIGLFVSLLFGGAIQVALLMVFLVIGGIMWLTHVPAGFISYGFYGFTFFSGAILCIIIYLAVARLPEWGKAFSIDKNSRNSFFDKSASLTEWMSASPAMAAFLLLAASFIGRHPLNPNPGMTTLACFLVLSLSICRRLNSEPIGVIALIASAFAQALWALNPGNGPELNNYSLIWSGAFFLSAIIVPFIVFRSHEKWNRVWMSWAVFEAFQAFFIFWAADHLWTRDIAGWTPLALVIVKVPAVALLIRQLKGTKQRNAILAFHGGALLFYMSAVPIMLLKHGWIGLALVFEATALLWLNTRVEHPGLRWTSLFMAPAGLIVLLLDLHLMKGSDSLMILNPAVLSVAACVLALSWAVRLSSFPVRELAEIELPRYYLWLAVSVGFYFLNLIVADVFTGPGLNKGLGNNTLLQQGHMFDIFHSRTPAMAVVAAAGWISFGLCLTAWPKGLGKAFKTAGTILLCLGILKSLIIPFHYKMEFTEMTPMLNAPTLLFVFSLAALIFLTVRNDNEDWPFGSLRPVTLWGCLLAGAAFCMLNIEIAQAFGVKGRPFSLMTYGSLPHQLGYSLGWLSYSITLLIVGIKWSSVKVRWAALIFLVITSLKIFFKDLWSLGQLYRVASFVGLALVLILVSFLYQRFLSDRRKDV